MRVVMSSLHLESVQMCKHRATPVAQVVGQGVNVAVNSGHHCGCRSACAALQRLLFCGQWSLERHQLREEPEATGH